MSKQTTSQNYYVRLHNIDWDTEEDGLVYDPHQLGLPQTAIAVVPASNEGEAYEEAVERLSDTFGWLILGYETHTSFCCPTEERVCYTTAALETFDTESTTEFPQGKGGK